MQSTHESKLPITQLLILTVAGFIAIMTETLPAGILPQVAAAFNITESLAGQTVTVYGIGSLISAIPIVLLTQGVDRRTLLLSVLGLFSIFSLVTAISTNFIITLAARLLAGMTTGVIWGLLPGYTLRLLDNPLKSGKAMAIVLSGTPIALSLGVPIGTYLSKLIGWRILFAAIAVIAILLCAGISLKLPTTPALPATKRPKIKTVFETPGVVSIILAVVAWMLSHNMLYTYVSAFMARIHLESFVSMALFIFGISSIISIWYTGLLIDKWLRELTLVSLIMFISAVFAMIFINGKLGLIITFIVWGLSFGGAATLLQTAMARAVGAEAMDLATPISSTFWNLAISTAGLVGGLLLNSFGAISLPISVSLIGIICFIIVLLSKNHGFVHTK